ncbi:MAG: 2Fe-2S iron-sulfur cluster binding domain-containing protein, partial [Planctomycetes bacterium]|nr:2Fe-2S iron-sulfur cluster binding domain-containing protein [Planctomycetota bacterium]
MAKKILKLTVNGSPVEMATSDNRTPSQFLREILNLTGTKVGCDMGTCGCCTVTVNGRPRLACLTLAMECAGAKIETIEALKSEALHPLQRAFSECGGSQCGFCT